MKENSKSRLSWSGVSKPTEEEFLILAKEYNKIPVYKIIDFGEPVDYFEKIRSGPFSFLLESCRFHPFIGRYSFLGTNPYLVFKSKGEVVEIREGGAQPKIFTTSDPLSEFKKLFKNIRVKPNLDLPPFSGGAVGFFSYDLVRFFEKLPLQAQDDLNIPDIYFMFIDDLIVFDHFKDQTFIISNANIDLKENKREKLESYRTAVKKIEEMEKRLKTEDRVLSPRGLIGKQKSDNSRISVYSNISKKEFKKIVQRCKEYIKAGDIFQANLSQRLKVDFQGDSFELYKILSSINPSPFACYLEFEEMKVVSCSPERLLRVKDKIVETRPIAGTRPRGKTKLWDSALADELILNEKERAEHIMLVDLERNDLGRVCKYGTVRVDELMVIEDYSHVFHIVSNVQGILREDKDRFDLLRAAFPGGTITGCPKVRCMEIIEELEPVKRGIYTGSIGYLSYGQEMDLNIVIRTFLIKDRSAYIQVGAGIVADSVPEREYYETLYKAEALLSAVEKLNSGKMFGIKIKRFKPQLVTEERGKKWN